MALVVDASVAVRWLFDLPGAAQADALLENEEALILLPTWCSVKSPTPLGK
ncbi:MAG: hypothetical protein K2Y27_17355 [Xanthobacteraceae bacterium]|nr:hypothetical protein [Xanthobacteraceae bacterium]